MTIYSQYNEEDKKLEVIIIDFDKSNIKYSFSLSDDEVSDLYSQLEQFKSGVYPDRRMPRNRPEKALEAI